MQTVTGLPSSADEETFAIPSRFATASPFSFANTSAGNAPFRSVAVVITGDAPVASAISRASAFAPPMWPESTGMTCSPSSSRTSTGGSSSLSRTKGATERTAIPAAPMKTRASLFLKAAAHTSSRDAVSGIDLTSCMSRARRSLSASLRPLSVKLKTFIIIPLPCEIQSKTFCRRALTYRTRSLR